MIKSWTFMGWQNVECGERISRLNALRDANFDTAASAGQAPLKEERALLPGKNRRPADIFLRHWCESRDAALDVTMTHPLKNDTRAGAAATLGHAMQPQWHITARWRVLLSFVEPRVWLLSRLLPNPWDGFHPVVVQQLKKIASALARHTAERSLRLFTTFCRDSRCSLLLQRG